MSVRNACAFGCGLNNSSNKVGNREVVFDTFLSGTCFQHLAGTNVTVLHCNESSITDAGLEQLKNMTQLVQLQLIRTQVTDDGLQHLNGLANLKHIILRDTKVTAAGIAKLQKALPDCKIE